VSLKKARNIVVRGQSFKWKFSGKTDRYGNSPLRAHVVVQGPGKPLVAWIESSLYDRVNGHNPDEGQPLHRATVAPKAVAALIERCLDAGWDPTDQTSQYVAPPEIPMTDYRTCLI